jgi:hypothetical protein
MMKKFLMSGHSEWVTKDSMKVLVRDMSAKGYVFNDFSKVVTKDSLKNTDVIIISNSWNTFTASEIAAIKNFVTQGGGLLLCGVGWAYSAYKTGAYPMNTLGARYYMKFTPISHPAILKKRQKKQRMMRKKELLQKLQYQLIKRRISCLSATA